MGKGGDGGHRHHQQIRAGSAGQRGQQLLQPQPKRPEKGEEDDQPHQKGNAPDPGPGQQRLGGARVGIMDDIGQLLGSDVVCILIGERPGLATGESMSAYMGYQPNPDRKLFLL